MKKPNARHLQSKGMHLLIINGWSMPEQVWDHFLDELSAHIHFETQQVINIDQSLGTGEWLNVIDEKVLPNTLLLGWSLGGMLAVDYAARKPEKIAGLCCLQMTPKFVAGDDWFCAMDEALFSEFLQLAGDDIVSLTKRFGFLVTTGAVEALKDLKYLKKAYKADSAFSKDMLESSLKLLGCMDVRQKLNNLKVPQLYLYGEHDALVPVAVASKMPHLLRQEMADEDKPVKRISRIDVLPTMAHCPLYSSAKVVTSEISRFVGEFS